MEWFQLIAIAILSILWSILTYNWVKAEKKARNYFDTMINVWNENTRLKEQLSLYQKSEWDYEPLKWLDKHEDEVSN